MYNCSIERVCTMFRYRLRLLSKRWRHFLQDPVMKLMVHCRHYVPSGIPSGNIASWTVHSDQLCFVLNSCSVTIIPSVFLVVPRFALSAKTVKQKWIKCTQRQREGVKGGGGGWERELWERESFMPEYIHVSLRARLWCQTLTHIVLCHQVRQTSMTQTGIAYVTLLIFIYYRGGSGVWGSA